MGICCTSYDQYDNSSNSLYPKITIPRPPPVEVSTIQINSSDSDIPLFASANSGDDDLIVSDVDLYDSGSNENTVNIKENE